MGYRQISSATLLVLLGKVAEPDTAGLDPTSDM
jgi:hypothetical protein